MTSIDAQLKLDTTFGFLNSQAPTDRVFHPVLVANSGANTMLKAIRDELRRSRRFVFSVAFITPSALALLKQALLDFDGLGTIVTSTYLGFNSPAAFRELLNLKNVDVYVYADTAAGFHAKGYVFEQAESITAIVGSSNLTEFALLKNHEWNLRFSALPDGDIVQQLNGAVRSQIQSAVPLTREWIDTYETDWMPQGRSKFHLPGPAEPFNNISPGDGIQPNAMQVEALAEIKKLRDAGEKRAVVISATGTGKTILSALDVRAYDPKRMLFVVHREQIIDRAIEEFKRVLNARDEDFGKFVGAKRELHRRYVFATIQSLSRPDNLGAIVPKTFDYVLIDEVHRAGAGSYRNLLDRLEPEFLLGMTATPERTDGFNVFELFHYNVPYEIRLQKALEADMLAPFHYYGVSDFVASDGKVIDDAAELSRLVASERVDHLIASITTYGHAGAPVRGLIFCSRTDEARELSQLLNMREIHGRRLRTHALTGDNSIEERESVVLMLERGDLDYIVTVDIFNEGIDIPLVNQVIMLRQTKSSIIFTQQLGRGLRKAAGKDHLVVIDFIGNYANNYLVPIALFGDTSLSKDSIRKKMIDAQEAGAISGLSSVNFDKISKERVFRSIASTNLDSMSNLKGAFLDLTNRLGGPPQLIDFARFDTVDAVVVATKRGNYWRFLNALRATEVGPDEIEDAVLTFLSVELINGKRPHELLLLDQLLGNEQPLHVEDFRDLLAQHDLANDKATLDSVLRILDLTFFTQAEATRYGSKPLVGIHEGMYRLDDQFLSCWRGSEVFRSHVRDVIATGLYLARHRYQWSGVLQVGRRYSRKDVCRILNWESNQQSTIYGYKVDYFSSSCPIFVTYHKGDDVSASTKYEDEFLSPSALSWYTRSRRTLKSPEVQAIVENRFPLHLFAKKDDAEGTDFYYLGEAQSQEPRQEQMFDEKGNALGVVNMRLDMASPIESSLYEYLMAPSTDE